MIVILTHFYVKFTIWKGNKTLGWSSLKGYRDFVNAHDVDVCLTDYIWAVCTYLTTDPLSSSKTDKFVDANARALMGQSSGSSNHGFHAISVLWFSSKSKFTDHLKERKRRYPMESFSLCKNVPLSRTGRLIQRQLGWVKRGQCTFSMLTIEFCLIS